MFGLAHGVVGGLLGSEGGTVLNGLGKEGDVVNGLGEFLFSLGEETLGIDNGLLTLDLGLGVGVSLSGGAGDFSLTGNDILIVLGIGSLLFGLSLGNKVVDKSNNIINNTLGSEVNL